mgnify:CR=1 FL=1
MSGYFDDEDIEYNSEEEKSVASDEEKIYNSSKKGLSSSVTNINVGKIYSDKNNNLDPDLDDLQEEVNDDYNEEEDDEDDLDEEEGLDDLEEDMPTTKTDNKKITSIPLFDYENQVDEDGEGEDEEEDDEEDENQQYIKKFDKELNEQFIQSFHPECIKSNNEEIDNLCKIVRNKNGIIIDDFHKTNPYLTKYEKTKILGIRAKQINAGASPLIEIPEKIIDGYTIAELELKKNILPFIIRRPLPCGASEYWKLQDLEDISF